MDLQVHGRVPGVWTRAGIKKTAHTVLRDLNIKEAEIGLVFLDSRQMAKKNLEYRKINKPTDVLSFGYAVPGKKSKALVGDILICPSYARAQAAERKITFVEELNRLLIHGILHLSGMDHATDRTEKRMFGIQEKLVKQV